MAAVEAGDRDGWLALFADDAIVEDPIGASPLDPEGRGRHGKGEIAAFYDSIVAPNPVRFQIIASYAGGNEVANVGSITTLFDDGSRAIVDGELHELTDFARTGGSGEAKRELARYEQHNIQVIVDRLDDGAGRCSGDRVAAEGAAQAVDQHDARERARLLGGELEDWCKGAKGFFACAEHVEGGIGHQGGLKELA